MALEKPQLMADDCDIGARRDEGLDVVVFDDSGAQLVCLAHDARTLPHCGLDVMELAFSLVFARVVSFLQRYFDAIQISKLGSRGH